jgi:hypothetical protein
MMFAGLLEKAFFQVINLLPTWTPPAFLSSGGALATDMAALGGYAQGFHSWIDFSQVGAVTTMILAVLGISLTVWLARKILGIVSAGFLRW